ncbi:tRNA (guanosine(37)-N1)-methyltransferase TrmD [Helicobacter sp. 23-1045]
MRFTFLTLFSNLISGYFSDSILKRAIDSQLIEIEIIDFRAFSTDKHKKVDNYQASGGAGLVICADILESAIRKIATPQSHIIYLTPVAKPFCSFDAKRLAQNQSHIIFICGRYEGVDERVIEAFVDEVFCIGDYILTGGEIASLVLCDCISRHIPQVLGNAESLQGESFESNLLEAPIFTKNMNNEKNIANLSIPLEYIKGNHSKIRTFKQKLAVAKTKYFRPDLHKRT